MRPLALAVLVPLLAVAACSSSTSGASVPSVSSTSSPTATPSLDTAARQAIYTDLNPRLLDQATVTAAGLSGKVGTQGDSPVAGSIGTAYDVCGQVLPSESQKVSRIEVDSPEDSGLLLRDLAIKFTSSTAATQALAELTDAIKACKDGTYTFLQDPDRNTYGITWGQRDADVTTLPVPDNLVSTETFRYYDKQAERQVTFSGLFVSQVSGAYLNIFTYYPPEGATSLTDAQRTQALQVAGAVGRRLVQAGSASASPS